MGSCLSSSDRLREWLHLYYTAIRLGWNCDVRRREFLWHPARAVRYNSGMAIADHEKNKDLKTSYHAEMFRVLMVGLCQDYVTPFLLLAGGTAFHVGLLSSLVNVTGSLATLPSADLARKAGSRKKVIVIFTACQAAALITLSILALTHLGQPYPVIIISVFSGAAGALTQPCWFSLISNLVADDRRGVYFGWRARNIGLLTIAATFTAGCLLGFLEKIDAYTGFIILFGLAGTARLISALFVSRINEPAIPYAKHHDFGFWAFVMRYRQSNFVRFVFFIAGMNFSIGLAAPYFAVFMLEDLSFNYFYYTLINIIAPVVLYLIIPRWGRHADRIGNLKVLSFIAPLFAINPVMWSISQNFFWLLIAEVISGFLWSGFTLASSNFIYDAVTPEKRTRCIAYCSVINAVALGLGTFLGGKLLDYLPEVNGHRMLCLFLISATLRVIAGLTLPRFVNEVRPVEKIRGYRLLFSMIGLKPIAGIERKSMQV